VTKKPFELVMLFSLDWINTSRNAWRYLTALFVEIHWNDDLQIPTQASNFRFNFELRFISKATLLILMGSFVLHSCAYRVMPIPVEKRLYRSDDYIVFKLQNNETPSLLAERFLGHGRKAWVIEEANPQITFSTGDTIVIPLKEKNKAGLRSDGYQTVPILCYHRFGNNCKSRLCMPSHIFENQMRFLKDNGYKVITPEELSAFLEYRGALPKKSVMITVDDGYRSAYTVAYPILKKYGFTATLFVYTDYVGVSSSAITWKQLKEMKANGISIGSHTIAHSNLTRSNDGESKKEFLVRIKKELYRSKKTIDRKLKQNTFLLAYPYGYHDPRTIAIARRAGYKIAFTVKRGGNPFFANNMAIRRDQILTRNMSTFISRLKTFSHLRLK
jgi:peptidoglycan/xylan/chitin deacetylase (PgdA/CDA1 family)